MVVDAAAGGLGDGEDDVLPASAGEELGSRLWGAATTAENPGLTRP